MSNLYYPAQITPVTAAEFLSAMGAAWCARSAAGRRASDTVLRTIHAHWGYETGWGKYMYCYNVANLKAEPDWTGGVTYYQGSETHVSPELLWDFSPFRDDGGAMQSRWQAFPTLAAGTTGYLDFISKKERYAKAWRYLSSNPDGSEVVREYARLLKAGGFATAGNYEDKVAECYHANQRVPEPGSVAARVLPAAGTDPKDSEVAGPGIRPWPPLGDRPKEGHCGKCKGVYAMHVAVPGTKPSRNWRPGDPVAAPLTMGLVSTTGTATTTNELGRSVFQPCRAGTSRSPLIFRVLVPEVSTEESASVGTSEQAPVGNEVPWVSEPERRDDGPDHVVRVRLASRAGGPLPTDLEVLVLYADGGVAGVGRPDTFGVAEVAVSHEGDYTVQVRERPMRRSEG